MDIEKQRLQLWERVAEAPRHTQEFQDACNRFSEFLINNPPEWVGTLYMGLQGATEPVQAPLTVSVGVASNRDLRHALEAAGVDITTSGEEGGR